MPTPGIYPRGGPRPTSSEAEKSLYRALSTHLPPGWFAWHSLRIRTAGNLEGEGDFVLAIPGVGILVLEVKGGNIQVRDGIWYQNGTPLQKPPRTQALGYAAKLGEKLRERKVLSRPWIAVATAFPDCGYSNPPSEGNLDGAVLGQQDLPYLRDALLAMTERLFAGTPPPRDARWIEALHALWCETWAPRLALGAKARCREDDLVALDQAQCDLLDLVDRNPRFLVTGGPGTGKTLVAREMYQRLAARSRRPVFLCSTLALASGLRAAGLTDAWTVKEFAVKLVVQAGIPMPEGDQPQAEWTQDTWELIPLFAAADALPAVGSPYDAVIVDESQDLSQNDWELVKALAGSNPLWCSADEAQGFWANRGVPAGLFPSTFRLKDRYRCPEPLSVFADLYRPENVSAGAPAFAKGPFEELRVVRAPSVGAMVDKVAIEIQKALGEGARHSDVAVLSLAGQTRARLGRASRIGDVAVVRADDPHADEHVVADTFLRFKGLDRPWIILMDLGLGAERYDVRMHVGLTRATVGCVVVATAAEIAEDRRLAAVVG